MKSLVKRDYCYNCVKDRIYSFCPESMLVGLIGAKRHPDTIGVNATALLDLDLIRLGLGVYPRGRSPQGTD